MGDSINFEPIIKQIVEYGLSVLGAVAVLIIGRILAGWARKLVLRALARTDVDQAIVAFLGSLAYYGLIIFAVIVALEKFGVETASLVAVLGAAGFAVGFALQGSLSNFAAGIMLLIFRPYKIGDVIDAAGVVGKVREMHLFTTIVYTPDNIKIIIPNSKLFGDTIKNITAEDTRRVDMVVGIGYDSDIPKAMKIMQDLLDKDERVLPEPAPQIAVSELADSSVNLVVRPWTKTGDYWGLKFDFNEAVKKAFDAEGIEIPFPQMVVHKPS
ncbi:mechanosensitive ion channel [bacterium]|nr:mechanosensitive ion channel [bacterium]